MFLTICLNPTIQQTVLLNTIEPNAVNRTAFHSLDISGKGINVTRVLKELGAAVVHLTHAGGSLVPFFETRAREENLNIRTIRARAPIRICVTLLERHDHVTTEIVTEGTAVERGVEDRLRRAFRGLLAGCRAVIISGSKVEGYSDALYPDLARQARAADKYVICDFRGRDLINSVPCQPDCVKPNFTEFAATFFPDRDPRSRDESLVALVEDKIRQLARDHGIATVLTDGSRPILYADNGSVGRHIPPAIDPVNTTGCGDAFTAGFAVARLSGSDMAQSVAAGTAAAVKNALHLRPGVIS